MTEMVLIQIGLCYTLLPITISVFQQKLICHSTQKSSRCYLYCRYFCLIYLKSNLKV